MPEHPPALPHGSIEEIFTDVYVVTGTSRPTFGGHDWQYSRNMTIVREGSSLTLVNTVRLDDDGLAALDRLGRVEHVVRLGAFHGMDDAFYLSRYRAQQWALGGMSHDGGQATDQVLAPGGAMPVSGCSLFRFDTSALPEALLLLDREGGILISCDSLQNWSAADRFFDTASAERMAAIGFLRPANIGPGWRSACNPQASDFARLKELRFRHLVPGHGAPLLGEAHEQLCATFQRELGV